MKFYHRSHDHKMTAIGRANFNALQGRVKLALERLQDLVEDFREDADISFAEGIIRIDYLGQGVAARDLFEKAYHWGNKDASSARNLTLGARNEGEFKEWAQISRKLSKNDIAHSNLIEEVESLLKSGMPYWAILSERSNEKMKGQDYGSAAGFAELALLSVNRMKKEEELSLHRIRAQGLRALDKDANLKRVGLFEGFPPDERLALHGALKEIEKTISFDEYDEEMWNFRSAWCNALERYDESILYADKAIELRPNGYSRPYVNKADSLLKRKRYREAMICAGEAIKQAKASENMADIKLAETIIKLCSTKSFDPDLNDMLVLITKILVGTKQTCDMEFGYQTGPTKHSLQDIISGVISRAATLRNNSAAQYVPLMAELLDDFTPETAFLIMQGMRQRNLSICELCMVAAEYLAVDSNRALKRDAARFLCLAILSYSDIKAQFRQVIMEPAAASRDKMSKLVDIMQEELGRINPIFPKLIADQQPIGPDGIERARQNILSLLPSKSSQIQIGQSGSKKHHDEEKKVREFLVKESYVKPNKKEIIFSGRGERSLLLRLRIHMVIYCSIALVMAWRGAKVNHNINFDTGIFIGFVTAFLINRMMMMSFGQLMLAKAVQRFLIGIIWGAALGIGVGVVFIWGRGMSGGDATWFLFGSPLLSGLVSGLNAIINLKYRPA